MRRAIHHGPNAPLPPHRRAPPSLEESAYLISRYGPDLSWQTLSAISGISQPTLRRMLRFRYGAARRAHAQG
jgi:hypothetical protein